MRYNNVLAPAGMDVVQACTTKRGEASWAPVLLWGGLIFNGGDTSALIAVVGSGFLGTFVLHLEGEGPFDIPALNFHADQHVHIIGYIRDGAIRSTIGSLALLATPDGKAVDLPAGASLVIGGSIGSWIIIQGAVNLATSAGLTVSGKTTLTYIGLFSVMNFAGEGATVFEGTEVTVLSLNGATAGSVVGGLPGTITLDLATPLAPGGATGAHSFDKADLVECTLATCGVPPGSILAL
jgi:hypothetical protein